MGNPRGAADDAVGRARLAYISAGLPALSAPRRALEEPEDPAPPPSVRPGTGPEATSPPGSMPWARLAIGPRQVVALLCLLLCGVGVAVVSLGQSSASQVPVEVTTVSQPAPPTPTASPPPAVVRVHVLGAVVRPGVVRLPPDSIVADAIAAAGGLSADADPAELNLAEKMVDGQQVIVGTVGQPRGDVVVPSSASSPGQTGGLVNLNTASQAQLEELPGVGPVLAAAILTWREEHERFTTVADLQEVPGIGPKIFATLEPLVTV